MKKSKKALFIVFGILAAIYLIAAVFYCVLIRFGTMRDGGAPGLLGYSLRSVQAEEGKEKRFAGDVIITKELMTSEANDLKEGDVVVYMNPGRSTVSAPLVIGTIAKVYSYDSGVMAYSIYENGIETPDTIPALMVKEAYTWRYLKGFAGFHDFFWSLGGFLVFIAIPVILITGGIAFVWILGRKKDQAPEQE